MATEIIKKIRDVLIAFEIHQKGLKNLCYLTFYDVSEIQSNLDFSGAPEVYITNLIRVLSGYGQLASGEHALVKLLKDVQEKVGIDNQAQIAALIEEFEEYLQQHPNYGTEEPLEIGPNPYRGLEAFREEHAAYFFGREEVIQRLQKKTRQSPFVAVIGASGSGKSSLVFAGLVPRLRKEEHWVIADFRPRNRPFDELALCLIPFLYPDNRVEQARQLKSLVNDLEQGKTELLQLVRLIAKTHQGKRLLLIADQFEELYTLTSDKTLQHRFIDNLIHTVQAQEPSSECTLLMTMRADFMGPAVAYSPFADLLNAFPYEILRPMHAVELREVIERPAAMQEVMLEQGLTERLLEAVGEEPGKLPLLEFALTQMWEKQQHRILTHTAYEQLGGIEQALARYADKEYIRFTSDEQIRIQRIFTQLVWPGEGTEDTRRMATRSEIGEENWELVTKLADARLVVTNRSADSNVPESGQDASFGHVQERDASEETVEIVHETLIRGWQRLREWIETDREFLSWRNRLRTVMPKTDTGKYDEGDLLRGNKLRIAEEWLEKRSQDLEPERPFIQASLQARTRIQRRRNFVITAILVIALFVTIVVGFLWNNAETQRQKFQISTIEALNHTSKLRWNAHDELGALLAGVKAGSILKHTHASAALRNRTIIVLRDVVDGIHEKNRLKGHSYPVLSIAFSPDGKLLASVSRDNIIKLWQFVDSKKRWEEFETIQAKLAYYERNEVIEPLAFSPDSSILAWREAEGSLREGSYSPIIFWNIAEHRESVRLPDQGDGTSPRQFAGSFSFSPDGALLASENYDCTIVLWRLVNGQAIIPSQEIRGFNVAFSPDGRLLASIELGDIWTPESAPKPTRSIRLWDVTDWSIFRILTKEEVEAERVVFSPDGTLLASGNSDHTISIWQVTNGQELVTLKGYDGGSNIVFSPDGTLLAAGSEDDTITLWQVRDGQQVISLWGDEGFYAGKSLAFSPDGTLLASGSQDGTINFWSVTGIQEPVTQQWNFDRVENIMFSPDGTRFALVYYDGTLELRSLADEQNVITLSGSGHSDKISNVAFNADGTLLVSGSWDGTITLWQVIDGKTLYTLKGHNEAFHFESGPEVHNLAFTPDGRLLASALEDTSIKLWHVADGREIRTLQHNTSVQSICFSPDGTLLASGSWDGTITLWRVADGKKLLTIEEHNKASHTMFNPSIPLLASATDAPFTLFAGAIPPDIRPMSPGGKVSSLVFSPDGRLLVSGNEDGTIKLWHVADDGKFMTLKCVLHSRTWGVSFSPDGTLLVSGGYNGTIKIWDIADGQELTTLKGHSGDVEDVIFNSDGTLLVSAGRSSDDWHETEIIRWDLDLEHLLVLGCEWLDEYYLENPSANLSEDDKRVCKDILRDEPEHEREARTKQKKFKHLLNQGNIQLYQGRYEEALKSYREASTINPENPEVWLNTGTVYREMSLHEQALEAYRKVAELEPHHEQVWANIGDVFSIQGKLDKAIPAYLQQIEILKSRNKTDEAQEVFYKLLLAINQNLTLPYQENTLEENFKIEIGRILQERNYSFEKLYNMGKELINQGRLDEAIAVYRTFLTVAPDHDSGYGWNMMARIGVAFWEQGKLEKAAGLWNEVAIAYDDILQERDDLSILSSDAELALVQGDLSRCQERIATAMELVNPDSDLSAILPFFAWLADPEQGWENVMTAISELEPGVEFDWNFSDTEPAIARLDAETQQDARNFIAFFEGKIDLETLKAWLDGLSTPNLP